MKNNRHLEGQVEVHARQVDKIAQENAEIKAQAERDAADKKSLRNQIERSALLVEQGNAQRQTMEHNWEEAMNSMHDRDAVLEKLQNRVNALTYVIHHLVLQLTNASLCFRVKLHSSEAELLRTRQDLEKKEADLKLSSTSKILISGRPASR